MVVRWSITARGKGRRGKGVSVHNHFGSLDLVSDLVSNMGFLDLVFYLVLDLWTCLVAGSAYSLNVVLCSEERKRKPEDPIRP